MENTTHFPDDVDKFRNLGVYFFCPLFTDVAFKKMCLTCLVLVVFQYTPKIVTFNFSYS